MCTVSFVNSAGKIILTSNRDEQVQRPAISPLRYDTNGKTLIFPKDPKAGGTWFAADLAGNVLILLNGGKEKHVWNPPYRRSRGLIVIEVLSASNSLNIWNTIDLEDIEPFTMVLYQQECLYQLRWSGHEKEFKELNTDDSHLWSSSTLYSSEIRQTRRIWFENFINSRQSFSATDLFGFHTKTEIDDHENGLIISRKNLQTTSVTQAVISKGQLTFSYSDLISHEESSQTFGISN